jgi:UDP-N-acetylglucosamine pyrophosphorylase
MGYLETYKKRLDKEITSVEDLLDIYINEALPDIRKMIKARWLTGNKPDGSLIGVYSSESYSFFKLRKNPLAGGDVDLTLSGEMGNKIEISGYKNIFEIFSRVSYFDNIIEKYGASNFNITDEERDALFLKIENKIIQSIMNQVWRA